MRRAICSVWPLPIPGAGRWSFRPRPSAGSVAVLAERGYVGRGYLGLALQPLRRGQTGLIAVEVAEGGPAAAAGLLVGDIVTTWDGEAVGSMRALPDASVRTRSEVPYGSDWCGPDSPSS